MVSQNLGGEKSAAMKAEISSKTGNFPVFPGSQNSPMTSPPLGVSNAFMVESGVE